MLDNKRKADLEVVKKDIQNLLKNHVIDWNNIQNNAWDEYTKPYDIFLLTSSRKNGMRKRI